MTTNLDLNITTSELLIHAHDFLTNDEASRKLEASDPLLHSIVAGFLNMLVIYNDYKNLKPKDPFNFSKEIPLEN